MAEFGIHHAERPTREVAEAFAEAGYVPQIARLRWIPGLARGLGWLRPETKGFDVSRSKWLAVLAIVTVLVLTGTSGCGGSTTRSSSVSGGSGGIGQSQEAPTQGTATSDEGNPVNANGEVCGSISVTTGKYESKMIPNDTICTLEGQHIWALVFDSARNVYTFSSTDPVVYLRGSWLISATQGIQVTLIRGDRGCSGVITGAKSKGYVSSDNLFAPGKCERVEAVDGN